MRGLEGHNRVKPPIDYKCIGFECQNNDFYCVAKCPRKALSLSLNPMYETLGDFRWTADMITGTWIMAETGYPPERTDLEYNMGNSGGGFDKLRLKFPANPPEGGQVRDIHRYSPEPPKRRPGQYRHFHPRLRRRHVLRIGEPAHHGFQGPQRDHMEYLYLHRRGRLSRKCSSLMMTM